VPIRTINDFTSERVEIELVLAPEAKAANAIRALYAFTGCEASVSGRVVVLRKGRPCEMDVEEVLRENTARLLSLLEKELRLKRRKLEDEWHEKTLVQIFIENRIYKRIEECRTLEDVHQAIRDGLEPFRGQFRREIVAKDIEMLLGVRIRRISQFDIEKNRKEKDDIVRELERVEGELKDMRAYAVRYLRKLVKAYGEAHPRRTEIAAFERIEVRELTARELQIRFNRETGYLGHGVEGDLLLECSSLDKLLLIWDDGRYQAIPPPEKLFVDKNLIRCEKPDREKVFTLVYTRKDFGFTYLKRFAFGGTILNKLYRCTPEGARVVLLADDDPETIFVKYSAAKGQRIHQQVFHPRTVPVKSVKATGNQMTAKAIEKIAMARPRWWEDDADVPRGLVL
jgi:topoisomerase-4 subunit A